MGYFETETKYIENFACNLLNEVGINCYLNNIDNITDVDIKTADGIRIDVQYSKNFDKYGDYRLDIISAYSPINTHAQTGYIYDLNLNFEQNFERKYQCKIDKIGKLFHKVKEPSQGELIDYLDALIVFLYHGTEVNERSLHNLNGILLITKKELIEFLKKNRVRVFNNIKINDKKKYALSDKHGSAFVPINVNLLKAQTGCLFLTLNEFKNKASEIKKYLSIS